MQRNPTPAPATRRDLNSVLPRLFPFLVAAASVLSGCPLQDDYFVSTGDLGGARSSGGTETGGAGWTSGRGSAHAGGASGAGGASTGAAHGAGAGGDGGSGTGGCVSATYQAHEYAFCPSALVQAEARSECAERGMTLVAIGDQAENDWIARTFSDEFSGDGTRVFIGANDASTEGEWTRADGVAIWRGDADGEPLSDSYTNWGEGEPNDDSPTTQGNADCLTMSLPDGMWLDIGCDTELPYVCEPR